MQAIGVAVDFPSPELKMQGFLTHTWYRLSALIVPKAETFCKQQDGILIWIIIL